MSAVGVIGAGAWGANLVRTFFNLGALAGVAETDPAIREKLASQYPGVPLFPDHAALLKAEIPAVAVATPAATHYRLAKEALLAGRDVFVEKPLALSLAEARELVELAQSRGRILMAGHLLLYQPAVRWIKNFLSSGGLGRPAYLVQERLKLGRVRAVENVLWSFGVHDVAVLLYLVGEAPRRVLAVGRRFLQPGVEDEVHLHLEFESGVQAHLHVSWLWPENRRRLTIVGSEAMLTYDELTQEVTLHRKKVGPDQAAEDRGQEVVFRGEGEPLLLECRHFLECVETRRQPLSDGQSALAVVEVLERAQKQLEGGGPWKE
ncbi:MAG: Gfo/Idh/MocA family protein [Moorellales bacterium]